MKLKMTSKRPTTRAMWMSPEVTLNARPMIHNAINTSPMVASMPAPPCPKMGLGRPNGLPGCPTTNAPAVRPPSAGEARDLSAVDVGLQLLDEELLVVEHQADDVAHGDDADHLAVVLDEEMAGEMVAHQVRASRFGGAGGDERQVGAHRLPDRHRPGISAGEHAGDEIALGDEPDDLPALADRHRAYLAVGHQAGRLAAGGHGIERDQIPGNVAFDGGPDASVLGA